MRCIEIWKNNRVDGRILRLTLTWDVLKLMWSRLENPEDLRLTLTWDVFKL